jgi:hypothetical protein
VWIDKELYDGLQDELAAAKKRIEKLERGLSSKLCDIKLDRDRNKPNTMG